MPKRLKQSSIRSYAFRLAQWAHFLHLEPSPEALDIVEMATPQSDALAAHSDAILADRALLRDLARHPLQFFELSCRQALGHLPDFLAQLQQLLVGHLVHVHVVVLEFGLELVSQLLLKFFVVLP